MLKASRVVFLALASAGGQASDEPDNRAMLQGRFPRDGKEADVSDSKGGRALLQARWSRDQREAEVIDSKRKSTTNSTGEAPSCPYTYIGNGWCLGANGNRIAPVQHEFIETTVREVDHGATICETKCSADETCMGYMTQEDRECQLLVPNSPTPVDVDNEKDNRCFVKHCHPDLDPPAPAPVPQLECGFTYIGNGWCLGEDKNRIAPVKHEYIETTVREIDHGATLCETKCSADKTCMGYMTQEDRECQLLVPNSPTPVDVDNEKDNRCFVKHCHPDLDPPAPAPVPQLECGFTYIGNGWCLGDDKNRIAPVKHEYIETTVREIDHGATLCETKCSADETCMGYMTQEDRECQLLVPNSPTPVDVDNEKDNRCFVKHCDPTTTAAS